jgi:hypothetical protein
LESETSCGDLHALRLTGVAVHVDPAENRRIGEISQERRFRQEYVQEVVLLHSSDTFQIQHLLEIRKALAGYQDQVMVYKAFWRAFRRHDDLQYDVKSADSLCDHPIVGGKSG